VKENAIKEPVVSLCVFQSWHCLHQEGNRFTHWLGYSRWFLEL